MSAPINLHERVKILDAYVQDAKIIEAVDAFFHPDVHTQEGNGQQTHGLTDTKRKIEKFFLRVGRINKIILHSQTIGNDVTMSEFTFDLTEINGKRILWNEVLRRRWRDGLVIDERYYTAN